MVPTITSCTPAAAERFGAFRAKALFAGKANRHEPLEGLGLNHGGQCAATSRVFRGRRSLAATLDPRHARGIIEMSGLERQGARVDLQESGQRRGCTIGASLSQPSLELSAQPIPGLW